MMVDSIKHDLKFEGYDNNWCMLMMMVMMMMMMVMVMMMMMMMMTCQTFIFKYQLVPTEATQLVGGSLLW